MAYATIAGIGHYSCQCITSSVMCLIFNTF